MKNFLFDKFNNFTESLEKDSLVAFTKNLPGTLHLDPGLITAEGFPNWGKEENGFWTVTRAEARFYEHDGTIHCVSKRYDSHYCDSYRALTANLTGLRSLTLMETDSFQITNEDHHSCSVGDTVYYAKFVAPTGETGWPLSSMILTNRLEYGTEFYKNITDYSCEVYKALKAANLLCPEVFNPKVFLFDSKGWYLGIISDFSIPLAQSVDAVIERGMRDSTSYNFDEISDYGLSKWQALKT